MGKRELLLIAAFLVAGAIVYHVSSPPPAPGERSFSVGQLVEDFRRHIRGNRASADVTRTSSHPVDPATTEVRLGLRSAEITIVGEERADIGAEMRVHSTGYDDAEAQQLAQQTALKVDRAGPRLAFSIDYPKNASQTVQLTLKVPARLQVTIDSNRGKLDVRGVNSVKIDQRGDTTLERIEKTITGNQRGGTLAVTVAGAIRIVMSGTDARLEQIRGEANVNARSGGELKGKDIVGPIDIDSAGTDITLEKMERTTGMLRINASSGSLSVKGIRTEGRIDVRGTDVEVVVDRAAPLAIYSEGDSPVEITPPAGGYQLDAVAANAGISVPDGIVRVTTSGEEHRAAGPVNGGGPTITIRTSHGEIRVKNP
ncbi:MAG: hypothetical protein ABJC89_26325 [Acidobacteriota bacterium]